MLEHGRAAIKNAPGATNTESVQIDWLTQKEQSQPTL